MDLYPGCNAQCSQISDPDQHKIIIENETVWNVQVTELKISALMRTFFFVLISHKHWLTETFISRNSYIFIRTGLAHNSRSVKIWTLSLPYWQGLFFFSVPAQTMLSIPGWMVAIINRARCYFRPFAGKPCQPSPFFHLPLPGTIILTGTQRPGP